MGMRMGLLLLVHATALVENNDDGHVKYLSASSGAILLASTSILPVLALPLLLFLRLLLSVTSGIVEGSMAAIAILLFGRSMEIPCVSWTESDADRLFRLVPFSTISIEKVEGRLCLGWSLAETSWLVVGDTIAVVDGIVVGDR